MFDAVLHLLPQWSSFPSLNDWLKSYGLPTDNFVTFMTCTVNQASDVQLHLPWDVSLHLALLHVPLRVDMASWHVVCVYLFWNDILISISINFNQFHSISLRFTFATRGNSDEFTFASIISCKAVVSSLSRAFTTLICIVLGRLTTRHDYLGCSHLYNGNVFTSTSLQHLWNCKQM